MTKKYYLTRAAACAGAAALLSSAPHACAQSDNALLNKLVQKGILTQQEADQIQSESDQETHKAFLSNMGAPKWVNSYKFYGDFRGRFDEQTVDNPAFTDRIRLRYRLRAGVQLNMKDNMEVGFRLGTGDAPPLVGSTIFGGVPTSNNSTFQDNFSKKSIYVDLAYGKWTPLHDGTWMLSGTIGKMVNPYQFAGYNPDAGTVQPMVFDPDITPEGAAMQASYKFNDDQSLAFNGAAFVLDEESTSSKDPFLYGGQVIWNAKWTPKFSSGLGLSVYDIVNKGSLTTANVPIFTVEGNTRDAAGQLVHNYNPIVADGSLTYMLDSLPLYRGRFPIEVAGEYMNNPGAPSNNEGFWGGITLGKANKKGNWDVAYRYEYLESDAWYDQFPNDDNVAFYPSAPTGGKAGIFGGTNMKGHLIKFDYTITDSLTFTFWVYMNDLIHNPGPGKSGTMHALADLMWQF